VEAPGAEPGSARLSSGASTGVVCFLVSAQQLLQTGLLVPSPAYMSPEVHRTESLGVILLHDAPSRAAGPPGWNAHLSRGGKSL